MSNGIKVINFGLSMIRIVVYKLLSWFFNTCGTRQDPSEHAADCYSTTAATNDIPRHNIAVIIAVIICTSMSCWPVSAMFMSAGSKPCRCTWLSRLTFADTAEQIFGKHSADILISPWDPCNRTFTTSHCCFVHLSSPKVLRCNVSDFAGDRLSLDFKRLVM